MKENKSEIRISSGPVAYIYLVIALGVFLLPVFPFFQMGSYPTGVRIEALIFCLLMGSLFLLFSVLYGRSYVFDAVGIQCRFWGIGYRRIPWEEIRDAVLLRTGGRSGAEGLLLSFEGGMICRSKGERNKWGVSDDTIGDLCMQNKGLFRSLLKGKNHFIIGSYDKNWGAVLQLLWEHCQYTEEKHYEGHGH